MKKSGAFLLVGVYEFCSVTAHFQSNVSVTQAAGSLFASWFPSPLRVPKEVRLGLHNQKTQQSLSRLTDSTRFLRLRGRLLPLHTHTPKKRDIRACSSLKARTKYCCMLLCKEELCPLELESNFSFPCLLKRPYPVLVL